MLEETRYIALPMLLALVWFDAACAPVRGDGARFPPAEAPRSAPAQNTPPSSTLSVPPQSDAASLAWLEGRWVGSADGVDMEEHWTSAVGGALIGMHKDVKGTKMTSFEFLRIESTPKDGLVYFASPRSAPVTPFVLIEIGDKRAVFENKAHDFPKRILYWADAAGALHARVEGTLKGSPASEEWTWTKK